MGQTNFSLAKLTVSIVFLAILSVAAQAQFRAGVQGVVTDNSGGVIPGATVVLTNKETNQTQQTISSDAGFYRFSNLAPGLPRFK